MSKSIKIMATFGVAAALGIAAIPLASYADSDTATTTVTVRIDETFSISADATASANITNNAAIDETMQPSVTVTTNHAAGWTLAAKTTHTSGPALISGSNTFAAGVPQQGTTAWAIKGGSLSSYTALSTTDTTVASSNTATNVNGVATQFTIGVTAASNQASGSYTGTITWTGATQ